ncbi:MAG: hypothetical protein IT269_11075 [Saprospiraceae bacterium]|nr:hypothetical protein [Saprospiraceae bacterium]
MHAPVLLLLFNRPEHTRKVMERLRMAAPARVYIHADGPRAGKPGEAQKTEAVRQVVAEQIDWPCDVKTLFRSENMGLRNGVKNALDWFFEQEPYGVVIEDDCMPDLSFFTLCDDLLMRYAHDERIMHIGGSNLAEAYTKNMSDSYVFTRFSFVWGWASWRRAWQKMNIDLEGLADFEQSGGIKMLTNDPLAQFYMLNKFRVTQRRENNSWAYAWFYSILKNHGLCIVPTLNLVQNTGVGEADATHTRGANDSARLEAHTLTFPLKHPDIQEPVPALENHFFYTSQKKQWRLWLWYFLKKMNLAQ